MAHDVVMTECLSWNVQLVKPAPNVKVRVLIFLKWLFNFCKFDEKEDITSREGLYSGPVNQAQ